MTPHFLNDNELLAGKLHSPGDWIFRESIDHGSTEKKNEVSPEQCLKPRNAFSQRQWGSLGAKTLGKIVRSCLLVTPAQMHSSLFSAAMGTEGVNYFLTLWGFHAVSSAALGVTVRNSLGYKWCQDQVLYLSACSENKPPLTTAGLLFSDSISYCTMAGQHSRLCTLCAASNC